MLRSILGSVLVWPNMISLAVVADDSDAIRRSARVRTRADAPRPVWQCDCCVQVTAVGVLRLEVVRAENVLNVEVLGKSDPYCNVTALRARARAAPSVRPFGRCYSVRNVVP